MKLKRKHRINLFILAISLLVSIVFFSRYKENKLYDLKNQHSIQICFTPQSICLPYIRNAIRGAKKSIFLQAYSFTSRFIANDLIAASKRGVIVKIIADKSQINQKTSKILLLNKYNIPIYIDYKISIAHNKVIIIDRKKVISGSYNFTESAEMRNAENLIIIDDKDIAERYYQNFLNRQFFSKTLLSYKYFLVNKTQLKKTFYPIKNIKSHKIRKSSVGHKRENNSKSR